MDCLLVEQEDHVRVLTLNRPARYNALDAPLRSEVAKALSECEADDDVRALVITGSGSRAFCAGQDLTESATLEEGAGPEWMADWNAYFSAFSSFTKPIVAAVNGVAAGAGFETALLCHLRVASRDARFVMAEVDVGLPAIVGGSLLAMHLGQSRMSDLILTGRQVSADEAREMGLLHMVTPQTDTLGAAVELARELASKPRIGMKLNLQRFSETLRARLDKAQAAAAIHHPEAVASGQPQKAMRAFLEKRAAAREARQLQPNQ